MILISFVATKRFRYEIMQNASLIVFVFCYHYNYCFSIVFGNFFAFFVFFALIVFFVLSGCVFSNFLSELFVFFVFCIYFLFPADSPPHCFSHSETLLSSSCSRHARRKACHSTLSHSTHKYGTP